MRFLVIRFSSLGDVVIATAAVEALKRKFPDCSVTFLSKDLYGGLFSFDSRIEKFIGIQGTESPSDIAVMAEGPFDAVIDIHDSLRSRVVSSFLKSPLKLKVRKHSVLRRLMVFSRGIYRHKFDTLGSITETLKSLGINTVSMPKLIVSDELAERTFIETVRSSKPVIGIAPGAKHSTKIWTLASYASFADRLYDRGFLPVFLGNIDDESIIAVIRKRMNNESALASFKYGLAETAALISRLKGVIANDSGLMHVAGALGIPVVGIFGPTHPDLGFWPGYNPGAFIHSGEKCSPCSVHGEAPCRMERPYCMEKITPDYVLSVFLKIAGL